LVVTLLVALITAPPALAQLQFKQIENMEIPDTGCIETSSLPVFVGGLISDLDVAVSITHTWRSDLTVHIAYRPFAEDIAWVDLALRHDASSDHYYATFDSDAAQTCTTVCADTNCSAAPGPTCRPDQSLDAFNGKSPIGSWRLKVCDVSAFDSGTLVEWSVFVSGLSAQLDVDADGEINALTDGLLTLRYHFGFRGATLVNGAVGPNCKRCTAPLIEAFLAAP
jgi:subtilisin-like proprotein convertase family protein